MKKKEAKSRAIYSWATGGRVPVAEGLESGRPRDLGEMALAVAFVCEDKEN